MFVRLLAVLISNILCCSSILVCCRSLVQIKESWSLDPWQCDREHLVQSSALRSSARVAIERRHMDPHFPLCPSQPYAPSLQLLRRGNSEAVICNRSHLVRPNTLQLNAMPIIKYTRADTKLWPNAQHRIKRMWECDQSQHLQSSAPLTWQHTLFCL